MDPKLPSTGSSLQQRLQQRRDLFLKDGSTAPGTPGTPGTGISSSNPTYGSSRIGSSTVAAPNTGPPSVPPPPAPGSTSSSSSSTTSSSSAARNVREALNVLNNKENNSYNGPNSSSVMSSRNHNQEESNGKRQYEQKLSTTKTPPEVKEKPEVKPKKPRQLDGYVGFANLPNQVFRKAVKKGFEFTLMVVGESGLGKSTLINSMFLTDIYSPEYPGPSARIKKTVKVDTNKVLLKESGVNLTLTIVDTPGFGDAVDNSDCWNPVINFVESQYESFLDAETRVNRVTLPDNRVHACLYFIAPSGHGLKPLDVEYMQRLHDKVNIIPVIAKADTLTPEEISYFKNQIMNQISQSKIKIYEFPESEDNCDDEDDKTAKLNRKLRERVPFAVVGSNAVIEGSDGKKVRGRRYPWGTVDIENLDHCDFIPLRNMLIRTHLQDLKEVTNNVHYENYRCRKLAGVAGGSLERIPNKNPLAQIEEERKEHHSKLLKMEKEMEEVFERKVREKKQKLNDSEMDLEKRHRESKEKLEMQKRDLEMKLQAFEEERLNWERQNNVTMDELKRLSMESLDGVKKKKGGVLSGVSFRR